MTAITEKISKIERAFQNSNNLILNFEMCGLRKAVRNYCKEKGYYSEVKK